MTLHIYYCPSCDSFVFKTGEAMAVSCCGETLQPLTAGTSDGAREKHVPVVTHEGNLLHVQVGEVLHPMLENHYIQWIALVTEEGFQVRYLKPGEEPKAVFADVPHGVVYEYCNLHGLWKCEF